MVARTARLIVLLTAWSLYVATKGAAFLLVVAALNLLVLGILGTNPRLIGYAALPLCLLGLTFRRTSNAALIFTIALYRELIKLSYYAFCLAVLVSGAILFAGGSWIEDMYLLVFGLAVALIGLGLLVMPRLFRKKEEPERDPLPRRVTVAIPDHNAAERQAAGEFGRLYRMEQ